ncbi:MAG: hypothetical protein MUF54_13860, partial [Polyangiaceae bacterium]|nr:hypothetical protein [Polyangiaceae bacterium]
GAYLAVGVLMSSISRSQFVALLLSLGITIGLFTIGIGEFIFDRGVAHDLCAYVSVWSHMADFAKGLIDTRHLVFTGTLMILPLFMTVRVVDSWRWG